MSLCREWTMKYTGKDGTKNIDEYTNRGFPGFSVLVSIKIRRFELSTDHIQSYNGIRFVVFDFGNSIKIKVSVRSETRFGIDYIVLQPSRHYSSLKCVLSNLTNAISRMEIYGLRLDGSRVNLELDPKHTLDVSMRFYSTNNDELEYLLDAGTDMDELTERFIYTGAIRKFEP